jgi:hypothetical protein
MTRDIALTALTALDYLAGHSATHSTTPPQRALRSVTARRVGSAIRSGWQQRRAQQLPRTELNRPGVSGGSDVPGLTGAIHSWRQSTQDRRNDTLTDP